MRERIRLLGNAGWLREPAPAVVEKPRTLAERYSLEKLIGSGGYAQVWRAYDLQLHRHVAVKVPKPSRTMMASQIEDVLTEARQIARLRHVNIITVHDVVKEGAGYFIVTDLIDGETLADRLRRGPVPPAEAAKLLAEVARVIAYAHGQGVVHRDLKPANIFLDQQGRPHVGDFGLARSTQELIDGSDQRGTLAYSSPEQLDGWPLDGRTDIWSLGVILYEMMTDRTPFADDNPVRLRQAVLAAKFTEASGVPAPLMAVCRRCLSARPEDRFAGGSDLAAALDAAIISRRSRRWLIPVAVAAAIAVGLTIYFTRPTEQGRTPEPDSPAVTAKTDEVVWTNEQSGAICSSRSDGSSVKVLGVVGTPQGVAVNPVTGQIFWTDYHTKKIFRMNHDGTEKTRLIDLKAQPRGITVDASRGKLYWTVFGDGEPAIQSANLDGSGVRTVVPSTTSQGQLNIVIGIAVDEMRQKVYWVQPDGFVGQKPDQKTVIARANCDGTQVEQVATGSGAFMLAVDLAGNNLYWTQADQVWTTKLDSTDPRSLFASPTGGHLRGISLDLANHKMFLADYDTNSILSAALDGAGVRNIVTDQGRPSGIAFCRRVK